ncbi:hypothetical protein Tco_0258865, partial [Tanacetum coccineum]
GGVEMMRGLLSWVWRLWRVTVVKVVSAVVVGGSGGSWGRGSGGGESGGGSGEGDEGGDIDGGGGMMKVAAGCGVRRRVEARGGGREGARRRVGGWIE